MAVAYDALACVARVLGGRLSDPALAGLVLPALAHKFTAAPLADRVGAGCRVARTVGLWGAMRCGTGANDRVGDGWQLWAPLRRNQRRRVIYAFSWGHAAPWTHAYALTLHGSKPSAIHSRQHPSLPCA